MQTSPRKKIARSTLRSLTLTFLAVLVLAPIPGTHSGSLAVPAAEAQNFGQRTLQGKVLADTGAPVGGATIFLKNLKTRDVKSFTSTPDGAFRFAQVGMVDDYEVWAELAKKKSAVKTISSFDSRKLLDFDLKLK